MRADSPGAGRTGQAPQGFVCCRFMRFPPSIARLAAPCLGAAALSFPIMAAADPVISEFVADNVAGLTDENGGHSDWIEIHNPDATPLNLEGWHLTDSVS